MKVAVVYHRINETFNLSLLVAEIAFLNITLSAQQFYIVLTGRYHGPSTAVPNITPANTGHCK